MDAPEVLVIGAGPTGLVLAIWLTRLGISVRIIDRLAEPSTTSRAVVVQARTLELYRQLGLDDKVVALAHEVPAVNLWLKGKAMGRVRIRDMGAGLSRFPSIETFGQDQHERLLLAHLESLGVAVERGSELVGFDDEGTEVVARLKRPDDSIETCRAAYVAGCDGARSIVRHVLDIPFAGGTYSHVFYVADVEARGRTMDGELHVALDDADFLAVFPLARQGRARLVGAVRDDGPGGNGGPRMETMTWDDVEKGVLERLMIEIERMSWFATYRVHHRVAGSFRTNRVFLLGDAAHVHSPVGGQGMNAGIGDAINLAWKLGGVLRGRADAAILDTYESERLGFARKLVSTTDRLFQLVVSRSRIANVARNVAPRLASNLFELASVRRRLFETISQIGVSYRDSDLSVGLAGRIWAGDRMPWVRPESPDASDNFEPLRSLDWQVHVFGKSTAEMREACSSVELSIHELPWGTAAERAGLQRDAVYLVRPDGHVALADAAANPNTLVDYLTVRGLR